MNVRTQSLLFTAFIALVLAIVVWTRKERSRTTLPFFLSNIFLLGFSASYVLWKLTGDSAFLRAYVVATFFLAAGYMYLAYSYMFRPSRVVEALLIVLFAASAAAAVTSYVPRLDTALRVMAFFPPADRPRRAAGAVWLVSAPTLVLILGRLLGEKEPLLRRRYLGLFGMSLSAAGVISLDQLIRGGPIGPAAHAFYHYYLYQALVRSRSFNLPRAAGRLAVLLLSATFLAIVYGAFFFFIRPIPVLFFIHTLFAAFILMLMYEPLFAGIDERARELVMRGRGDVLRRIDRLNADLASQFSLDEIGAFLAGHAPRELDLARAAVYLADDSGALVRLAGDGEAPGRFDAAATEAAAGLPADPTTRERLTQLASESYVGPEKDRWVTLLRLLRDGGARWIVPLRHRDELVGIYLVGHAAGVDEAETMRVLRALADQAAVRIANARIYQRMRSQDRLATLGEMAASVAHEVRNPLSSMKGAAQYLLDENLPKSSREFVEIILDETNRLNSILTRYLDYARPFEIRRAEVDLNETVRAVVGFLSDGDKPANVAIEMKLDETLGTLSMDVEQIRQVLINLIKNAWEAQPRGGLVRVATRSAGDRVLVEVIDRGAGIGPAEREKLFMPFFSTKPAGSGLGLTISQRIALAHGGRIFAEPAQAGGSRFVLDLPRDGDTREPRP
ncbi:hypothetical protein K8I61_04710 [bacterium]|nr:hypothetical protein [bacterium]